VQKITRYRFVTPKGTLSMVTESNDQTTWVTEHLVKSKRDIDLIGEFMTSPWCDVEGVNQVAEAYGERGLVRSHIPCFDVFGQPGTWQDACCLYPTEQLILATYDDPAWVHAFLRILHRRKKTYIQSMAGGKFDLLELGRVGLEYGYLAQAFRRIRRALRYGADLACTPGRPADCLPYLWGHDAHPGESGGHAA